MPYEMPYINRELRWLSFNERILITAENPKTPLMERLKFIGIFSSNLDEFYAIRMGSLHRMLTDPEHYPIPPGIKPKQLIKEIMKAVQALSERVDVLVSSLIEELKTRSIVIIDEHNVTSEQMQFIDQYFKEHVRNWLFPIMLDPHKPFPYIKHVTIYLAICMQSSTDTELVQYALIEVPSDMAPRYVHIPSDTDNTYFIMLDDIIRLKLQEIFTMFPFDTFGAYTIKITRDGEYFLAEEVTKSLYEKVSNSVHQRSMGDPVRFVYDKTIPDELLSYIISHAHLEECRNIIAGGKYHNARDLISFPRVRDDNLYFASQAPVAHHSLCTQKPLIAQIEERDHLVSLPYHQYDCIIDVLREASLDPTVHSIKMTLYRVPEDSSVINALRNAARNGKRVTLFIELQARFDEKINMYWTEKLTREANITLLSGIEDFKVHSKICLITRKMGKKKSSIALIGTGNFNEITATLYSDHVLLTAHPKITAEVNQVFHLLEKGFADVKFSHLILSPFHTRKKFVSLIKKEIARAKAGEKAEIIIKLNNLVDSKMINHLRKAAEEGVDIRLLIRGICSLSTVGKPKAQKHISGKALIDRYLEHTRIVMFYNGGDPLYYLGSADWMERNLDNRIEVMTPVYDTSIKQELEDFLSIHWRDTYASYSLDDDSFNEPLQTGDLQEIRAQRELYHYYKEKISSV